MRKTYLHPETLETVVNVETAILAGSPQFTADGGSGTDQLHTDEDAGGPAISRRRSVWDDNED